MVIDVFYYAFPSKETQKQVNLCEELNEIGLEISPSQILNLRNAVLWALKNNADAIMMVGKTFQPTLFNFRKLFVKLLDIHKHNNFIFELMHSNVNSKHIQVSNGLYIANSWHRRGNWIILRPLFETILQICHDELNCNISISDIFNRLGHTKFVFSTDEYFHKKETRLNIIIPFRNVANYLGECIQSIEEQNYQNYRVFFIDDCSDDESSHEIPRNQHYSIVKNVKRKYALENIVNALIENKFNKDDIICLVDGDDKLNHPYVFNILNFIYSLETIELTYGSFRLFNQFKTIGMPYKKSEVRNIRKAIWKASHLKTFKYGLFKRFLDIDPNLYCLKEESGSFIKMPYDMALMFPLIEIAGYDKISFIKTPLYIYRLHDKNDHLENSSSQKEGESKIRQKENILIGRK